MTRTRRIVNLFSIGVLLAIPATGIGAPQDGGPSGSLMARRVATHQPGPRLGDQHGLRKLSLFAIAPPEPRTFQVHDLVQIIVRETSKASSKQKLDAEKDYSLDGRISAWPDLRLEDLLQLQAEAGRTTNLPRVGVEGSKEFEGEGKYERSDDFTARLSAEVIEILPNGNLVLEATTFIKTDQEEATLKVTGICRAEDITAANTVLSNQIHDLRLVKEHKGELKKASEKGIIAKVLDAIFAF